MANQGEIRANSPWKLKIPWKFHEKTTKKGRKFDTWLLTFFPKNQTFLKKIVLTKICLNQGESGRNRPDFVHRSSTNHPEIRAIRGEFRPFQSSRATQYIFYLEIKVSYKIFLTVNTKLPKNKFLVSIKRHRFYRKQS